MQMLLLGYVCMRRITIVEIIKKIILSQLYNIVTTFIFWGFFVFWTDLCSESSERRAS